MRDLLVVFVMVVAFGFAKVAYADNIEEAKAAFEDGKGLFDARDYVQAAAAFRKANRLSPNWKLFYNIGQCEAAAKRHGLALQAFESYLSQGGDDITEQRREELLEEIERLRKIVGAVEVSAPSGAIVYVDEMERERAPLPGPMLVAAGISHRVVIKLGEDVLLDRPVRVNGGQTVKVTAESVKATSSAPMAKTSSEETPGDQAAKETSEKSPGGDEQIGPAQKKADALSITGWILVGTGVALIAGGSVTGGLALSRSKELEDNCLNDACPEAYWDKNDSMKALGITTDVLFGVGAAAAVAGTVMLLVSRSRNKEMSRDVTWVPAAGSGSVGVSVLGRF